VSRRPWYAGGLRFACLPDCGGCCLQADGRDHVYVTPEDVGRLAAFLGLSRREFRRRHTRRDDGWTGLRFEHRTCPFLEGTRCRVHAARPAQCRTFPFWPEHLRRREAWEAVAAYCPGIGRGDRVPLVRIRSLRRGEGG
jgi:Fe-S-cluster containining protein